MASSGRIHLTFIGAVLLHFLSLVFFMAATAAAYAHIAANINTRTEFFFFSICVERTADGTKTCSDAKLPCAEQQQVRDAGGAFAILCVLLAAAQFILATIKLFKPDLNANKVFRYIYLIVQVVLILFGLVSWGLAFAGFNGNYCSRRVGDQPGALPGPSGPCSFIGWVFSIFLLLLELWDTGLDGRKLPEKVTMMKDGDALEHDDGDDALGAEEDRGGADLDTMPKPRRIRSNKM